MNQENREAAYQGRLPAMAPLANPYVPFQLENPPKYEAKKALTRGTLFPGLDLPFLGMVNKENLPATTLAELQALDFAIVELALYLDTHREDMEALELYRKYQETHFEKAWTLEKVKELLEEAGMEFLGVYDGFTKEAPKEDSERILVAAREKGK